MTGAMQGSAHSLRQTIRTRRARQWNAAAERVTARRYASHAGEIALIHSDFAHRFHLAKQEVCAATRGAMMQRLSGEKAAVLTRVRLSSAAEADVVRNERKFAHSLRHLFHDVRIVCCNNRPCPRAKRALLHGSSRFSAKPIR